MTSTWQQWWILWHLWIVIKSLQHFKIHVLRTLQTPIAFTQMFNELCVILYHIWRFVFDCGWYMMMIWYQFNLRCGGGRCVIIHYVIYTTRCYWYIILKHSTSVSTKYNNQMIIYYMFKCWMINLILFLNE